MMDWLAGFRGCYKDGSRFPKARLRGNKLPFLNVSLTDSLPWTSAANEKA